MNTIRSLCAARSLAGRFTLPAGKPVAWRRRPRPTGPTGRSTRGSLDGRVGASSGSRLAVRAARSPPGCPPLPWYAPQMAVPPSIRFHWTMLATSAECVLPALPGLQGTLPETAVGMDTPLDPNVEPLLSAAGLHLDQQLRPAADVPQVALSGSADLEQLAASLTAFAQHADAAGALVIDCARTPIEITEVPGGSQHHRRRGRPDGRPPGPPAGGRDHLRLASGARPRATSAPRTDRQRPGPAFRFRRPVGCQNPILTPPTRTHDVIRAESAPGSPGTSMRPT